MDVLADVLAVSGVRGTIGTRIEAGGTWGIRLEDCPGETMHAITSGGAWLLVDGAEPRELTTGDVVLLAAGTVHTLASAPGVTARACDAAGAARARESGEMVTIGSAPARTRLVTMHYDHDPAVRTQVLRALPPLVHVRADAGAACFDDAVRLLGRELAHPQLATAAVLNSLADIMLIQVLRAWLATWPAEQPGTWLGMLADPVVGEALERIHREPSRPWTATTLASAIAVSRATLARRFPAAIGQSPGAYLTQWRMDLAAVRLRDTDDTVESVAAAVGYTSLPAFSRAFSRAHGNAPGRYRARAREASA
ncbi:AraC family transcriptional regulator [Amycolatopsis solani]|uniref:AraC family transcriptional regulator n=1 Tax=Amycolatopsis solani TaxID=3028615 RepID=UPI0025AFA946|nr:AraC family transcriptional regulator [Amycolatopsis sp. MEP2-6]